MTGAATTFGTKTGSATRSLPSWALPAFVGAAVFIVGALIVDGLPVGVTHDDSMYVVLAKSLATGHGYRWLNIPGAPPATHYPPGYPAVLALLWLMFPTFPASVVAFKLANAAFMGLAAVGVASYARARFGMSERGAAILALVCTLGIPTLTLGALVMSEPLFLALLIPTLIYAEHVIDEEAGRWRELLVLGVIAGALTLVRTQGIALIGATAVILCMRRRLRDAAVFGAAAMVMVLPWQLWVATHSGVVPAAMSGNYESYGAWLHAGLHDAGPVVLVRTALRTTRDIAQTFEVLFAVVVPPAVRVAALLPLGILAAIGGRPLWRRSPVAALFLALYFAMVIVWPFPPSRFVWAVWPLVLLVPLLGQRELLAWRPSTIGSRAARATMLVAAALLAVGYSAYNVRGYRRQWWASIPVAMSRDIDPLLQWVATHTPRNAVLATEIESSVYLYTSRSAVPVTTFTVNEYFQPRTPAENAAAIRSIVEHYHPMAVVVSSSAMRSAVRELAVGQSPMLVVVDTFPGGGIVLIPQSR